MKWLRAVSMEMISIQGLERGKKPVVAEGFPASAIKDVKIDEDGEKGEKDEQEPSLR